MKNLYPNTEARALELLCAAFGIDVRPDEAKEKFQAMLDAKSHLSAEALIARLQGALLSEGLTASRDHGIIKGVIETQTNKLPTDNEVEQFIDDHYDDEFGAAQDALEDTLRDIVDNEFDEDESEGEEEGDEDETF
jgi:hypothetical protein